MNKYRPAQLLGHYLLVLLLHGIDGCSHAAYEMRLSEQGFGSVPALFWSYLLREAEAVNMVLMLLGRYLGCGESLVVQDRCSLLRLL